MEQLCHAAKLAWTQAKEPVQLSGATSSAHTQKETTTHETAPNVPRTQQPRQADIDIGVVAAVADIATRTNAQK